MAATRHTYDMGLIGNGAYMAHISKNADINWMCWPRFDSSFIFGRLLDPDKGGYFYIKPNDDAFTTEQYYLPNTNVLITEFSCASGQFRVTDFAPRFSRYDRIYKPLALIRIIEPIDGHPKIKVGCQPKGDYGRYSPQVLTGSNHIRYEGFEEPVRLTSNISTELIKREHPFTLSEPLYLYFSWGIHLEAPLQETIQLFLDKTTDYWKSWVANCAIGSFHQEAVIRSALVLKLHQYDDTGAIIAAATTSLPESPGSGRNWDYRYCWLRDSYYTLAAFNNIGQHAEVSRYARFIENIVAKEDYRYHPLYSICWDESLTESTLDLSGYLGNAPVRIGNQAYTHKQNDAYGQILVSLLPLYIDKRIVLQREPALNLVDQLLIGIEKTMNEPDAGLWEYRSLEQLHCYTFLFHWAGACAAKRIGMARNCHRIVHKAEQLRKLAVQQIENCYDSTQGVYTQAIGSSNLDASQLQLITLNYLSHQDPKTNNHLKALEKALKTKDGLFYRYRHGDDFGEPETTFLICSFWYVEALACVNRIDEARAVFEHLLSFRNHLGLLSEDICEQDGSQWGNFPQAYSHVGLMNAVFRIANKLDTPAFLFNLKQ